VTGADTLVELGSGASDKTRLLLGALAEGGRLRRFTPFDVCEPALADSAAAIAAELPGVQVHGVVGDFHHHLGAIPRDGRRMIAFRGGTMGNFTAEERRRFLFDIDAVLGRDEWFLLGTDLVKDVDRLLAAYDDAAGVTAAFDLNALHVMNRDLGADF